MSALHQNKSATDSNEIGRALPLVLITTALITARQVLIGLRAADRSCEAPPSLIQGVHQQPLPFCSSTVLATPFPRKSRHRSEVKCLPQSTSQPLSPSLTLIALLPFAFCRLKLQQWSCQRTDSAGQWVNSFSFSQKMAASGINGRCSRNESNLLRQKVLVGVQYRLIVFMN